MAVDTPMYGDALQTKLTEAAKLHHTASDLYEKAQAAVRAADAATAARRSLLQAIAQAGGAAFAHPDLGDAASPALDTHTLTEIFSQLEVAEIAQSQR